MSLQKVETTPESIADGVGAYTDYQKFGIEGYELYTLKGRESPHFVKSLKEAQELTKRRQTMYMDAMVSSPKFLETYFGTSNYQLIKEHLDSLQSTMHSYNKINFDSNLNIAYESIMNDEENQKRVSEFTKNTIIANVKNSASYQLKEKKAKLEKKALEAKSSSFGVLKLKEYCREIDNALAVFVQTKVDAILAKPKEVDKIRQGYCKEHFLKDATKKAYINMYTNEEVTELKNITTWLENMMKHMKIEDKSDEITDAKITYEGESAITAVNYAKSKLNEIVQKNNIKDHLFNTLVESIEMMYYQGILQGEKGAEKFIVKKPPLVDDLQSGADFIVIDPDDKDVPYISYDLKTTMNEHTIENEIIANKYDKVQVKALMENEGFVARLQQNKDGEAHELANDELKIRKKRPLWGMFAFEGQTRPVEQYVVPKSILGFPSNLAYSLVAKTMTKVGRGEEITPQILLGLVNENDECFQGLTTFMQSGIVERNRIIKPHNTTTGYASKCLLESLIDKKKVA